MWPKASWRFFDVSKSFLTSPKAPRGHQNFELSGKADDNEPLRWRNEEKNHFQGPISPGFCNIFSMSTKNSWWKSQQMNALKPTSENPGPRLSFRECLYTHPSPATSAGHAWKQKVQYFTFDKGFYLSLFEPQPGCSTGRWYQGFYQVF